jgi:U4/U6.U5 tri-snRNP-associated protein 2
MCRNVDFYDLLSEEAKSSHPFTTYDLIANIVHDGKPDSGTYRIQMINHVSDNFVNETRERLQATGKWYELEDLHVKEILPQIITLTESYIQVCCGECVV